MSNERARGTDPENDALDWLEKYVDERSRGLEQTAWQLPGLSLTAQAFLFNTGLSPTASGAARLSVAVISVVIAVVTIVFLIQTDDSRRSYRLILHESRRRRHARSVSQPDLTRDVLNDTGERSAWRRAPPVTVWLMVSIAFCAVDLFVLVAGLLQLAGVANPLGP